MAVGRDKLIGHGAMIMFALIIATSFTLGKLTVPHIGPAPINAARFLLASVIMGALVYGFQKHKAKMPVAPWRYVILTALMSWYFLTMFIALGYTSAIGTSAVYTLTPMVTAALGFIILRQLVRPAMALSLAIGAAGAIWVIFRADISAILAFEVGDGEAIFFTGCVAHALFAVLLTVFRRGEDLSVSTFYIVLGNTIWIGLFGFTDIMQTDWLHLPAIVWVSIVYLAIFPSVVSFSLLQFAARRLPASKVMAYGYLVPIFVIGLEGLAGHGWTSFAVMAGALVTCLGLVILYFTVDN